jgi:hypothetical protein
VGDTPQKVGQILRGAALRVRREEWVLFGLIGFCALVVLSSRTGFDPVAPFTGYWNFFARRILLLFVVTRIVFYLADRWQPTGRWPVRVRDFLFAPPERRAPTEAVDLEIVRGTLLLFISLAIYSNVKARVPYINPTAGDPFFAELDRTLFGSGFISSIEGWFRGDAEVVEFFAGIYLHGYFWMMVLIFLLYMRRDRFAMRWTIMSVCFTYLLGILLTVAHPSYGPCFTDPDSWRWLAGTDVGTTQNWLAAMRDHNQIMLSAGYRVEAVAFAGIAAFPSLHVGHMFVMLVVALRTFKPYAVWMLGVASLTFIATIGFGWHYAVDAIGGAALAAGVTHLTWVMMRKWDAKRAPPPGPAPAAKPAEPTA